MSKINKLVLFDIDKTLIKSTKAHFEAFRVAFKKVYGVNAEVDTVNYDGMTDQQIIIKVLKNKGLNEADIMPRLQECMTAMSNFFNQAVTKEEIVLLGGVRELLKELDKQDLIMGLVTGNLEQIARGKLRKAGIEGYFKVGGFGSDHVDRAQLIRIAVGEASQNFNFQNENTVFVFGDTPKDIRAAKEGGAKAIGVTTGIHNKEQLMEAGADIVLENLKDKCRILEILEIAISGVEKKNLK